MYLYIYRNTIHQCPTLLYHVESVMSTVFLKKELLRVYYSALDMRRVGARFLALPQNLCKLPQNILV